jgi:hypothetical protein
LEQKWKTSLKCCKEEDVAQPWKKINNNNVTKLHCEVKNEEQGGANLNYEEEKVVFLGIMAIAFYHF